MAGMRAGRVSQGICRAAIPTLLVVNCLVAHVSFAAAQSPLPLREVADIPLGGGATRLDYESLDPGRHLMFIAHLGDSAVIAFDTSSQQVVTRTENVSHVHGVLAIPELGMVYASATGANEVVAIDEKSLTVVARIQAGTYPDGMAYAPKVHKLYVSDEHGDSETIIDVKRNTRVATIPLGGDVGNTQYDPVSEHIFVNVQTLDQLIEIDPATDRVIARIDLPGSKGNHGLLIVPDQHLAFIACEDNDRLLVLDLRSRQTTGSFDVGRDPDVLAYDEALGYLYVASESGVVSLFHAGLGKVTKLGEASLGPNAHVVAVDAATHRSYFPLENVDGRAVLRIMEPR